MNNLRNKSRFGRMVPLYVVLAGLLFANSAQSQDSTAASSQGEESALTGTVVSSTRNTLVVRGEEGQYRLFVFDRDTVKPATLAVGSTVRVVSTPGEEAGARVASEITTVAAAPMTPRVGTQTQPVPQEIRRLERDIKRQVRRFQAGVRAGMALDPELVLLGVHAEVGPFFNPHIHLRPNVEFAFGEVTSLFALNLEGIYTLPVSSRVGRWSPYVGVGPGFTFLHQNFEQTTGEGRKIDFGDFNSNVGLKILGGLRYRRGTFMELKTSVYSRPAPTLRFIVGYNF